MYNISAEFMYPRVINAVCNYSAVENGFNNVHRWN